MAKLGLMCPLTVFFSGSMMETTITARPIPSVKQYFNKVDLVSILTSYNPIYAVWSRL